MSTCYKLAALTVRFTLGLMAFSALVGFAAGAASSRPNIVFILADDLGQGDLGCYGQKLIQTPHLDRMAAEGTRFMQAYCGTSICAPSRSSLVTGLHIGHCPVRGNRRYKTEAEGPLPPGIFKPEGQLPLPAGAFTVGRLLKDAGYATACMGKWGMGMFDTTGSPLKVGFDHFFGYNCQYHAHQWFPKFLYRDDQRIMLDGKTYSQNLIEDDVLAWVRANRERPFFLFYAVTLPHGKHEIDDLGQYAAKDWTPMQKAYAAQITRLDTDCGRLMALIKELGLDEKTIVFFAGDNGPSFPPDFELGIFNSGNGLRGCKGTMYEGGLRQAAIVRWPGVVPAGKVSDEPWAFWDFLPTAAELAGVPAPEGVHTDGLSLVSMLRGGPSPKREYFYWELHESRSIQAVRFGDWKAVRNGPSARIELYDLKADPHETKDLATEHPDLVSKAETLMKQARSEDPNWPLTDKVERPESKAGGAAARVKASPKAKRAPSAADK